MLKYRRLYLSEVGLYKISSPFLKAYGFPVCCLLDIRVLNDFQNGKESRKTRPILKEAYVGHK